MILCEKWGDFIAKIHTEYIEATIRAILYPQSHIGIAFKNEEDSKKYFNDVKEIVDNQAIVKEEVKTVDDTVIEFKNGSYIKVLKPKKEDIVRGKRADMSHWLYNFEYCGISDEDFEEVIKPFLNK